MEILTSSVLQADTGSIPWLFWLGIIGSAVALYFAYTFYNQILEEDEGTDLMIEIAEAVRDDEAVAVVAAGERWRGATGPLRPAIEDHLGAGALDCGPSGTERAWR